MQKSKLFLFVATFTLFVTISFGQHQRYAIRNGLGIYGGLTQFDINTDNFATQSEQGYIGGMAATVELPHKWYTVSYNVQLSQNYFNVFATPPSLLGNPNTEQVEYKIFTTQVALLFQVKLMQEYVTLDMGPMLQYNSNLELEDESQDNYIIDGYDNLTADEITEVTKFNINGAAGVTAGFRGFKLRAQYIYGFTNILNKLEKANLDTSGSNTNKFEGNMHMWAFTAMIYF